MRWLLMRFTPQRRESFWERTAEEISPFVFGVDIGAVVQEILNHSHAIVAGGKVERSGVTSLQVSTVHILRGAKLLCKTKPNNIKPNAWFHIAHTSLYFSDECLNTSKN